MKLVLLQKEPHKASYLLLPREHTTRSYLPGTEPSSNHGGILILDFKP